MLTKGFKSMKYFCRYINKIFLFIFIFDGKYDDELYSTQILNFI